jgi:hypothetical protein
MDAEFSDPLFAARFWSKVEVKGPYECWPWRAARDDNGYGRFYSKRHSLAHRIAYVMIHPDEPELGAEEDICHRCDNPGCCNPRHIWRGNALENVYDALTKGRFYKGEGRKGATNGNSKLTDDAVLAIRRRVAAGERRVVLAREYGISQTTIGAIYRKTTWAHL